MTAYTLGRQAGVDPGVISRFLTGQRDIRLATADRLAQALSLQLVEVAAGNQAGPDPPHRRPSNPCPRPRRASTPPARWT